MEMEGQGSGYIQVLQKSTKSHFCKCARTLMERDM